MRNTRVRCSCHGFSLFYKFIYNILAKTIHIVVDISLLVNIFYMQTDSVCTRLYILFIKLFVWRQRETSMHRLCLCMTHNGKSI